jgi:hypothetical protein
MYYIVRIEASLTVGARFKKKCVLNAGQSLYNHLYNQPITLFDVTSGQLSKTFNISPTRVIFVILQCSNLLDYPT